MCGELSGSPFFCFSAFMELNFSSHKIPLAMRMEKVYHKDTKSEIMRGDEHAFD